MIADELRRQADVFTDLLELKSKIGRDPSERAAPRELRQHTPRLLQRPTAIASRSDDDDDENGGGAGVRLRKPGQARKPK
jgi:hypothetical protein